MLADRRDAQHREVLELLDAVTQRPGRGWTANGCRRCGTRGTPRSRSACPMSTRSGCSASTVRPRSVMRVTPRAGRANRPSWARCVNVQTRRLSKRRCRWATSPRAHRRSDRTVRRRRPATARGPSPCHRRAPRDRQHQRLEVRNRHGRNRTDRTDDSARSRPAYWSDSRGYPVSDESRYDPFSILQALPLGTRSRDIDTVYQLSADLLNVIHLERRGRVRREEWEA